MSTSHGLLHVQTRVQAQVLRPDIRGLYGLVLLPTSGGGHEQAIPLHTRWLISGAAYFGRHSRGEAT